MSGKEQLSFTLRFVEDGGAICEEFLGFVQLVNGLSGKDIAEAILTKVNELGLDIKNCRDQGYDGAGAMSGFRNGCSANILEINRKALYTHCYSHRLNLAVSKTSKISSVNNMIFQIQRAKAGCF